MVVIYPDHKELHVKDYPAAHSNDTNWFGVDEEGNVAFFDPGVDGATLPGDIKSLPEHLQYDRDFGGFTDAIWDYLNDEEQILVCNRDFPIDKFPELLSPPRKSLDIEPEDDTYFKCFIALIHDPEVIKKIAPGVTSLYFPEVSDTDAGVMIAPVVANEEIITRIEDMIQKGQILGYTNKEETDWGTGFQKLYIKDLFSHLGIYVYKPPEEGYIYPFHRQEQPDNPLKIKDFPEELTPAISSIPVNFDEDEKIQLFELGYSEYQLVTGPSWIWVSVNGDYFDKEGNPVDEDSL